MKHETNSLDRRSFIRTSAGVVSGLVLFPQLGTASPLIEEGMHIIGPKAGFSPQIGTLVSMMTWMRTVVLKSAEGLGQKDLDFLFDAKSNTIGAMLLHLAATESYYQANTFEGRKEYNESELKKWDAAMNLGDKGRQSIKGNNLDYYLSALHEVREKTLAEFRKRDDHWLASVDPSFFQNQPTNNYCKWFHVCEHESNHNGQIKWIKGRLPGAKEGKE